MKMILAALLASLTLSASAAVLSDKDANHLADAIYHCEGGAKARKPYGILSVSCSGEADARQICLRTIRNNWLRWEAAGCQGTYLEFLARRYAPTVKVANDPSGLNRNWLKNVSARMQKNVNEAAPLQ